MPDYVKQVWADADGTKPLSAARMNVIETGIDRASITVVTSLPGSPTDGDEVYYQVDATNGIYWFLRYRSASASAHKWEYQGGPSLTARVDTQETTTSTTYADLATVGPQVTVPLAGDYEIVYGVQLNSGSAGVSARASLALGATAASDSWNILNTSGTAVSVQAVRLFTGLSASDVVKMRYRIASGTLTALLRFLFVRPVRVS